MNNAKWMNRNEAINWISVQVFERCSTLNETFEAIQYLKGYTYTNQCKSMIEVPVFFEGHLTARQERQFFNDVCAELGYDAEQYWMEYQAAQVTVNEPKNETEQVETIEIVAESVETAQEKQFKVGNFYLINYGTTSKIATFIEKEDDKNYFRDSSGLFAMTDSFLKKGTVIITEMEGESESDHSSYNSEPIQVQPTIQTSKRCYTVAYYNSYDPTELSTKQWEQDVNKHITAYNSIKNQDTIKVETLNNLISNGFNLWVTIINANPYKQNDMVLVELTLCYTNKPITLYISKKWYKSIIYNELAEIDHNSTTPNNQHNSSTTVEPNYSREASQVRETKFNNNSTTKLGLRESSKETFPWNPENRYNSDDDLLRQTFSNNCYKLNYANNRTEILFHQLENPCITADHF